MAETDKKYRAGYYYAVEPKERINESDKYIHGLTFEVVFRIYDRDGKEQFFDEINEDHVPEVFIHRSWLISVKLLPDMTLSDFTKSNQIMKMTHRFRWKLTERNLISFCAGMNSIMLTGITE